jgi:hypothetical protein
MKGKRKIIVLKLSNFFFISKGRTLPEQQQHPSFNRFSSFRTETALHVSLARKPHLSISDFVKTKNFFKQKIKLKGNEKRKKSFGQQEAIRAQALEGFSRKSF